MAVSPKLALKAAVVVAGFAFLVVGIVNILQSPGAACITLFMFPIVCIGNAFAWVGGLITAILGLVVLVIGVRVV